MADHKKTHITARLDELAQQFDDGRITFVELRMAERELEAQLHSSEYWHNMLMLVCLFLVGLCFICYEFIPQYQIASFEMGAAFILDTRSGEVYGCSGFPPKCTQAFKRVYQ